MHYGIIDERQAYTTQALALILGLTRTAIEEALREHGIPALRLSKGVTLVCGKLFIDAVKRCSTSGDKASDAGETRPAT